MRPTLGTSFFPALPQGAVVQDKYRVNGLLEMGPDAAVYRADHARTGRLVVLRLFHAPHSGPIESLARLASQRASRSDLPDAFVEVVDFGLTDDGRLFLVTELVQGTSFADLVKQTPPLAPIRALELAMRIGEAIEQTLNLGFVDVSLAPSDIVVEGDQRIRLPRSDVIVLHRLGLVDRQVAAETPVRDPRYLSPEELAGLPTTERDVVYRFGVLLYELLCTRPPFEGTTAAEVREQQREARPEQLRDSLRGYPASLGRLVARLIDSNPTHRPPNLTSILNELWEAAWPLRREASPRSFRAGTTPPSGSRARRWAAWSLPIAILAGGALVGWLYVVRIQHEPAPAPVSAAPTGDCLRLRTRRRWNRPHSRTWLRGCGGRRPGAQA